MKFFDRMLTVFLARQNPDSTSAKPRFMKNTSDAVISTHIVSIPTFSSAGVCAMAGVAPSMESSNPAARIPGTFFLIVPPWTKMNAERRRACRPCHAASAREMPLCKRLNSRFSEQISRFRSQPQSHKRVRHARVHLHSCMVSEMAADTKWRGRAMDFLSREKNSRSRAGGADRRMRSRRCTTKL